jgi:hypothetical protein
MGRVFVEDQVKQSDDTYRQASYGCRGQDVEELRSE